MNEISTEVNEMNFLQRIRLRIFKRSFKISSNMMQKYNKAPEYIKFNEEVLNVIIDALANKTITLEDIQQCPQGKLFKVLKSRGYNIKESILRDISFQKKFEIMQIEKELFEESDQVDVCVNEIENGNYQAVKTVGLSESSFESNVLKELKKKNPDNFYNILQNLIKHLDIITIKEIIKKQPQFLSYLTIEQQRNFADLDRLKFLSENLQEEYFLQNPQCFSKLSEQLQKNTL
ncbi:MAG: hypothetical protein IKE01_01570 [Clostridia bacterium]|nr:hypothetical protein [Clostridia bacterium]